VPLLREFYPGICLTTEEKARKTLSQGKKTSVGYSTAASNRNEYQDYFLGVKAAGA